jgi:hypothetical protein
MEQALSTALPGTTAPELRATLEKNPRRRYPSRRLPPG